MEPINTSERKSLKQTVIQAIKNYILDENLKAGSKLPTERKFMEMFDVSRSVVREALSYLENTDVIRIRQGQGAFLNETNIESLLDNFFFLWQINNGNIRDVLGLRAIFETGAIDEIVKNDKQDALDRLKETVEQDLHVTTRAEFHEADVRFHKQLLQATNNQLFIQLTNMITNYFFQVQHIPLTIVEYQELAQEHIEIVDAMIDRDAVRAKKQLTTHINNAKQKR